MAYNLRRAMRSLGRDNDREREVEKVGLTVDPCDGDAFAQCYDQHCVRRRIRVQ